MHGSKKVLLKHTRGYSCSGIFGEMCEYRTKSDILQVSNITRRIATLRVSERGLYI